MNAVSYTPRYPSWDRFRPMLLKISLAISILFCFFVINVEAVVPVISIDHDYGIEEKVFVMETPVTVHKTKEVLPPPEPPKPPKIKEVIPTRIEEVDKLEKAEVEKTLFQDPEVDVESTGPVEIPVPAVAPEIEIVEPPDETIHNSAAVEQMPIFGDCSLDDYVGKEIRLCSDKALLQFIHEHLKYPRVARENGIEGTVVIQFIVDKDGSVTDVTIAKDIDGGCGLAAKKVIASLPAWRAGKQNGRPVKVLYTVPVKFKLN